MSVIVIRSKDLGPSLLLAKHKNATKGDGWETQERTARGEFGSGGARVEATDQPLTDERKQDLAEQYIAVSRMNPQLSIVPSDPGWKQARACFEQEMHARLTGDHIPTSWTIGDRTSTPTEAQRQQAIKDGNDFIRAINESAKSVSQELARGVYDQGSKIIGTLKEGTTLDMPLASWSTNVEIASAYATGEQIQDRGDTRNHTELTFHVTGAVGGSLRDATAPATDAARIWSQQTLTGGRFVVDRIETMPLSDGTGQFADVYLKQEAFAAKATWRETDPYLLPQWFPNDFQPHPKILAAMSRQDDSAVKAASPSEWAKHPVHPYHDAIVAHYAPQIAKALKQFTGLKAAYAAANKTYAKHRAVKGVLTKDWAEFDAARDAARLETKDYEGKVGNKDHITRVQTGTVPTSTLANLQGVSGERPGEHRNRQGDEWKSFVQDIKQNGVRNPIFVTVDHGERPKISEGNHRRDAAVEAGIKDVPVHVQYFGHAEQELATKAAGGAALTPAQAAAFSAVQSNVKMSPAQAQQLLQQLIGDSYVAGAHTAAGQIGSGATVATAVEGLESGVDWDAWEAGDIAIADLVRDGGLGALLDQVGITIQSIQETMLTRLGNALADSIVSGDSIATTAQNIDGIVDRNAMMIANTETARAMSAASMDTYQANGIEQWRWLAEDDACDVCADNADNSPYDVDDGPTQPQHPNCRCAYVPIVNVPGGDGSDDGSDSSDDSSDDGSADSSDSSDSSDVAASSDDSSSDSSDSSDSSTDDEEDPKGATKSAIPDGWRVAKWGDGWESQERAANGEFGSGGGSGVEAAHNNPVTDVLSSIKTQEDARNTDWIDVFERAQRAQEKSLTLDQEIALGVYTGGAYVAINDGLRGNLAINEGIAQRITDLDEAFKSGSRMSEDRVVARGIVGSAGGIKQGQVLQDNAFLSTSLNENIAKNFGGSGTGEEGYLIRLTVPTGTPCLLGNRDEAELIFQRNTPMVVDSVDNSDEKMAIVNAHVGQS